MHQLVNKNFDNIKMHVMTVEKIESIYSKVLGPGEMYWLRRCATIRTVPGSIPDGVTGFFSDILLPTVPWN